MKAKEKAEELYNIFDMIIYSDQDEHDQCKRCAIRCAEQVINTYDLEGYDEEDLGGVIFVPMLSGLT